MRNFVFQYSLYILFFGLYILMRTIFVVYFMSADPSLSFEELTNQPQFTGLRVVRSSSPFTIHFRQLYFYNTGRQTCLFLSQPYLLIELKEASFSGVANRNAVR
jgi:hypothetical protein